MHNPRQCFSSQLRNEEEEEEDLETTKKKKKKKKKQQQQQQKADNYHISTQMSQNSKKQDSKYDSTKNLVFMFKFQTRKMQNKRKTEFARIYLLACELQRSLLSPAGGGRCKSELRLLA
jgi:hypothetical protein